MWGNCVGIENCKFEGSSRGRKRWRGNDREARRGEERGKDVAADREGSQAVSAADMGNVQRQMMQYLYGSMSALHGPF